MNYPEFENEDEIREDDYSERVIYGEPLYYTTGHVAKEIDEPDSTVRYWCDEFDEVLNIEKTGASGKRRQFTKLDIKRLEYIKYLLKDENLTIRQAKEFLSSPEGDKMLPITKAKEQIMIEALANSVSSMVEKIVERKLSEIENSLVETAMIQAEKLNSLKEDIINEVKREASESEERTRSRISKSEEKILKRLDEESEAIIARDRAVMEEMRKKLEDKSKRKQGFFAKLFKGND